MIHRLAATFLVLIVAGCTEAPAPSVDPAAVPSSSLVAHGDEPATGPIVELASGTTLGIGWRYSIYESASGWCRQFETASATRVGCGDPLPAEGAVFGGIGSADGGPVEGIVSEEVATVWLVDAQGGGRVPARLVSLEPAGLPGNAFIGFAPDDVRVTHLQAVALSGEILETFELP